jgi:hypothetical protein
MWEELESVRYDVIVAGGGLAGLAAAHRCAAAGLRVLVVEPTGTLGREVVLGRAMFAEADTLNGTGAGRIMLDKLVAGSAWFDGAFDTTFASSVYDEVLAEAGVDVLFHAWPVHAIQRAGRIDGLRFASKRGYVSVSAPRVVDASRRGRIVGAAARRAGPSEAGEGRVSRRYLFQKPGFRAPGFQAPAGDHGTPTNRAFDPVWFDGLTLDGARLDVEVRATQWPGELRVALETTRLGALASAPTASVVPFDRLGSLTHELEPLDGARLVHVAEETLEVPSPIRLSEIGEVTGLAWAGLWDAGLQAAGRTDAELPVAPRDDDVFALLKRGEDAAVRIGQTG